MNEQRIVLVVRMWRITREGAPDQVRGSLERIPGGAQRSFSSLAELCAMLPIAVANADKSKEEEA